MQCVDITLEMYGTPLCDKTFSVLETGSQSTNQLVIKKSRNATLLVSMGMC